MNVGREARVVALRRRGRVVDLRPRSRLQLSEVGHAHAGAPAAGAVVRAQRALRLGGGAFDEHALARVEVDVFLADQSRRGVDPLDLGLVEVQRRAESQGAARERARVRDAHVHAARLRVDRVREEPRLGQILRGDDVADVRIVRGEAAGEHDAVVDVDLIDVQGQRRRGARIPRQAEGVVHRLLFPERGNPDQPRELAVIARQLHVRRFAGDEVRERRAEVALVQRRRAEAAARRAAQIEHRRRGEGERDLAVDRVAEVVVVLAAECRREEQLRRRSKLHVDVGGLAVAARVHFVDRLEAGEALRAGVASAGAVEVGVRARLAGEDLVRLAAVLESGRDAHAAQPVAEVAREVEVGGVLHELEPARVELRRRDAVVQRGDRCVQRVADDELHPVRAVGRADVHGPRADQRAIAERGGEIPDVGADVGDEAVRIHLFGVARGDVLRSGAVAVPRPGETVAAVVAAVAVERRGVAGRHVEVVEEGEVLRRGVADDARLAGAGAIGLVAVQHLAGEAQHASRADRNPVVHGDLLVLSVALGELPGGEEDVGAGAFLEDDVDDAGDRIGAVLRGRAVAEDLDALDGADGDRVEVRADIAARARAEDVDQRRGVAALAVDQDEHLIGAESAQRRGVDVIAPVRAGLPVGVEGRRDVLQELPEVELPRFIGDLFDRDDVDRHGRIRARALRTAAADLDDHRGLRRLLRFVGGRRCFLGKSGQGEANEKEREHPEELHGYLRLH